MDPAEKHSLEQSEAQELRAQCESLRQIIAVVLVLLLILSGAFDIYLWRQTRTVQVEVQRRAPQINQFVADFNKVSAPAISEFVNRLKDYEKTHPDFSIILKKYNLGNSVAAGAQPPPVPPGNK